MQTKGYVVGWELAAGAVALVAGMVGHDVDSSNGREQLELNLNLLQLDFLIWQI